MHCWPGPPWMSSSTLMPDAIAPLTGTPHVVAIRAMNVGGPVTARVSSGDVNVKLTTAASVTAETTSGDVNVIVPAGSYRISSGLGSGDERIIGLVNDPESKNIIDVRTRSGDATVSGAPTA